MTPHEITPQLDTQSIALIEQITRRVMAESSKEVTILVEQMKSLKSTIHELNESIKVNFVRKEEFVGWTQRVEHMEAVKVSNDRMDAIEKQVQKNEQNIVWTARSIIGIVIAAIAAFLFKP